LAQWRPLQKKQKKEEKKPPESMNIALSGNSGSGGSQQEFWLAREDLQNVGGCPGGCLASSAGNSL